MYNKKLFLRAISIIIIILLVCTILPGQYAKAEVPEITPGPILEFSVGYFVHGIFGNFNGDSQDEFMAIYSNYSLDNPDGETFLILFDGWGGDILWQRNFTQQFEPIFIMYKIDGNDNDDVLVKMFGYEEIPIADSNQTYSSLKPSISRINGPSGEIMWTIDYVYPSTMELVSINGVEQLLVAGYHEYGTITNGLHTINLESGVISHTGIVFNPTFNDFILDQLPNGDDIVVVYGDRAIEAYLLDDWSLVWEYDFFDNEVYHVEGWTGLLGGHGTVGFQAKKDNITSAMMVLDTSTGNEMFVTDLSLLDLFSPYIFLSGFFNEDNVIDYLSFGYADDSGSTLCAIDGNNGTSIWQQAIPLDIFNSNASTTRIIDMDADGNEDIFMILDSSVLSLSGSTGETLWETSLYHEPDRILTGDLDDSSSPNVVYVHDNSIYSLYLNIPRASNSIFWIIGIIIAAVSISSFVLILKKKAQNQQK